MAHKDDQIPVNDLCPSEKPTSPTTMEIPEGQPPEWSTCRRATLSPVMLSPGSTTQKLIASGKIKSCFILLEKTNYDPSCRSLKHFNYEDTGKSNGGDGEEKACKRPTGFREFNRDKLISSDTKSPKERSDVNRNVFTSMLRDLHAVSMEDVREQGVVTDRVSPKDMMVTTPILLSDSESDQMTRTDYEYPSIDSDTIGDTFSVNFDAESISSTGSSETLEYSESIPDGADIDRDFDEDEERSDEPPRLEILDSWTISRPTFDDPPLLSPPLLTTENNDIRYSTFSFPKSSENLTACSPDQKSRLSGEFEEPKTFCCQDAESIPLLDSRESSNDERSPGDDVEKTKSIESLGDMTHLCVSNSFGNEDASTRDSHQFSNDVKGIQIETGGDQTIEVRVTSKLTPTREDSGPHSNQQHQLNYTQDNLNSSEALGNNNISKTITSKPSQTADDFLVNLNQQHSLSSEKQKASKNKDNLSIATSQSIGTSFQQSPSNENIRDGSSPKGQENEKPFNLQLSEKRQVDITAHQSHASQSSKFRQSSKTNVTGTDSTSARNEKTLTIGRTQSVYTKHIVPLPDLDSPGQSPGHSPGHSPGPIHDSSQPSPSMPGRIVDTEDMQTVQLTKLNVAQNKDVSALPLSEETIPASPTLVIEGVQSVQVQTMDLPGAIETTPSQQLEHPSIPGAEHSENIVNDVFFASSTFSADTATNSVASSQETSRNSSVASLAVDDEHFEDTEYQQIFQQIKEGGKHSNTIGSDTGNKDMYAGALTSSDHTETTQGTDHVVYPMLIQEQQKEKEDPKTDDVSNIADNVDNVASSQRNKITSPEFQPSFSHEGSQCPEVCGFVNEVTVDVCDFDSVDSSVSEVNSEIERAVASITDHSIPAESKMTGVLDDCLEKLTSDEIRRRLEVTDSSSCASSTVEGTHSTNQISVDIDKDQTDRESIEGKRSVNNAGDTNQIVVDAEGFVQATSTVTSVSRTPTVVPLTHRQKNGVTADELCKNTEHKSVQETGDGVPDSGIKPSVVSSLTRSDGNLGMKTLHKDINQSAAVDVGSKTDQNHAQKPDVLGSASARSDLAKFDKDSRLREIDTAISLAIMSEITTLPSRVDPNYKVNQSIASSGAQVQETNMQSSLTSTNVHLTSSVHDYRGPGEMGTIRPKTAGPTFPGSINPSGQMFTSHQGNSSPSVGTQGSLNHSVASWPLPRGRGRYKGNFAVVDYSVTENEKPEQFIELRRCLTQERKLYPGRRSPLAPKQPPLNPPDRTVPVSQHDWPVNLKGQGVNILNGVPIEFPGGKRFIAFNKEAFCYPPQHSVANPSNEHLTAQNQLSGAVPVSRVPQQMPPIVPINVHSPSNSYPQQQQYPRPNLAHSNLSMSQYPMHPNFIHQQRLSNFVNVTDRARKSPGVYPQQGLVIHPPRQNTPVAGSRHDQSHRITQPRASTPRIASVSPDVLVVSSSSELQSQTREHLEPTNAYSFTRAPQPHEVGLRGQLPGAVGRGLLMAPLATNKGVDHLTLSYQAQQKLFHSVRGSTTSTDVEVKQTHNKGSTLTPTQVTPSQNPPTNHISSDFEHMKRMATAAATNKMIRSDVPVIHQNHSQKAALFGQPPGADQADRPAQAAVTARCDPLSLPASAFIGNLAETNRLRAINQEEYDARKSQISFLTQNKTAKQVTTEIVDNPPQSGHMQKDFFCKHTSQPVPQSKDDQTIGQREGPSPGRPRIPTPTPPQSTPDRATRTLTNTEEALLKSLPEELRNYLVDQCRKGGAFRETLKSIIQDSLKDEEVETQNVKAVRVWGHTVHHLPNQTPKGDAGHSKDGNYYTPYANQPCVSTEAMESQDPTPPPREQYDTQPQQQAVSLTTYASKVIVDLDNDARQKHSKEDCDYGRKPIVFFNPAPFSTPLLEADKVLKDSVASSQGVTTKSQRNEAIDLSYKELIDFEPPVYEGQRPMPCLLSNSNLCHRAYTAGEQGPIRASSVVDLTSNSIPPPINSFLQNNLSSTQLVIRNKLLERRLRIQSRSISTPDIVHGYAYPAEKTREKLVESNKVESETTSAVNHPTVQGARRKGRRVFGSENSVSVIKSSHSVNANVNAGNADQTIHQVKDAIDLALNRQKESNEPTHGPDTTAKYPKMKSKLQKAWINASCQQPSSSKDSQGNLQPSVEARPCENSNLNPPQPSTILPIPNKPVTCSKDMYLPDTPAITKPVLRVEDNPNPSSKMLSQKRKRGRPKGSGPVSKKTRPDTSSSKIELECHFCSFKSFFRSEIRTHVKNDHFAKFCKETTTTRKKKTKRDNKNKLMTNKGNRNPVSTVKNAAVVPGPPAVSNRNTLIASDQCDISPSAEIRHSSGDAVQVAVTATVVNVIPGNLITTASYVAIQSTTITGGAAPTKQAKPQVAVSPSVQQKIQPAYAPYTKTHIGETRAAEAISTATPATTSTVRPSLNERPIQTPYRCTHCKQYCNSSRELLIHKKFQHTNTKGLHMCFNCGYTAKSEYRLRKHILKWHQNQGVENHRCTRVACGQSFPTQDQLQTHMQTHDAGRNYVCDLCDAKYHNITGLRYHQQRHKLNYPHKCKECGLKFKSSGMLNRHEFQKNHISS